MKCSYTLLAVQDTAVRYSYTRACTFNCSTLDYNYNYCSNYIGR